MSGIKTLYAGKGMTMWETLEEAEASFREPSHYGGINRGKFMFWLDENEGRGLTFDEKTELYRRKHEMT